MFRFRPRTFFAISFLIVSLVGATAFAGPPTDYVKKRTREVTSILQEKNSPRRQKKLEKVLNDVIDFRELASRALGDHWKSKTPEQQQQFLDLLSEMLKANYESKLEGRRLGKDYTIDYVDEKTRGDKAIVKTVVVAGDEKKPVDYKLLHEKKGWTIYDVVIDDVSLEETYRDSYVKIIEDEGWDSLIQRMKDKAKELREQAEKARAEKKKKKKAPADASK